MLIVIVIIGILAAALIPRLTGIQARARDTARSADMRNVSSALEVYALDNGGTYPSWNFVVLHHSPSPARLSNFFIPQIFAQEATSSLDTISGQLGSYLTSLPTDPNGNGIATTSAGTCVNKGKSYAYYTAPGLYAITSSKESKKGNASSCDNTIDKAGDGAYEKVGKGLDTLIASETTDENCFGPRPFAGKITSFTCLPPYNHLVTEPDPNYELYKDIVIPDTIDGIAVMSIEWSFWWLRLTSVVIPNSVTYIANSAFASNLLTEVILPSGLEFIGNGAFSNNLLTSITIPNSITTLNQGVFYNNKLTSVIIPNSITSIWQAVFKMNELTSITIPSSVTSIWHEAFYSNKLTSVTIPDSVQSIWIYAFEFNYLQSLNLPASVTSVWKDAFKSNWPQRISNDLTDFVPNTNQVWNTMWKHPDYPSLNGVNWVKQ